MIKVSCIQCNNLFDTYPCKLKMNEGRVFCGRECYRKSQITKVETVCFLCNKNIIKKGCSFKKYNSIVFCSKLCSNKYNSNNNKRIIKSRLTKVCDNCHKEYQTTISALKQKSENENNYCNMECYRKFARERAKKKVINRNCMQCGEPTQKLLKDFKKNYKIFCSKSCASYYNNANIKRSGKNVSHFEKFVQCILLELYTNIEFLFNKKTTIKSELDIYIPSLNLAFELNGPTHYRIIYDQEKLTRTIINDIKKLKECEKMNVELIVIDVSKLNSIKINKYLPYLEKITDIIDYKIEKADNF